MDIAEILKQPEGRRLEFKSSIPEANGLEKIKKVGNLSKRKKEKRLILA